MKKLNGFILFLLAFLVLDFGLSKTKIPFYPEGYLYGFSNFIKKAERTKGQKRIILIDQITQEVYFKLLWQVEHRTKKVIR